MAQENIKKKAIVLLDVNKVLFFEEGLSQALQLDFQPSVVSHREVVSEKQFYDQISLFIQQNKLEPAHLYILLVSQLFFVHDFQADPSKKTDIEEQKKLYLDAVPFERVSSFTQKAQNVERVFAVNQDYYEILQSAFVNAGFTLEGVAPVFVLGDKFAKVNALSQELVQAVFSQESEIKKHNLVSNEPVQEQVAPVEEEEKTEEKKDKKTFTPRVIGLVVVFGLLLLALGVVIYFQILRAPEPLQDQSAQTTQAAPSPVPTLSTQQIVESLTVEIRAINTTDSQVLEATELLDELGVSRVDVSELSSSDTTGVSVFFLPDVVEDARNRLIGSLNEVFGDVTSEEDSTLESDVLVIVESAVTNDETDFSDQ